MICERRTKALGLAEEKEEYGYWPSAHSTRVMPSDQTSEAKEYGLPASRSGDMYACVPMKVAHISLVLSSSALRPKSEILTSPAVLSKMLPGLTSRCTCR